MAITDLQISEELMTDAPSIKYRGDEGPKSPQEEQQMMVDALLKEEYNNYIYDLLEQRPDATPMSFEEFRRMVIAEGQMSGGQPLPEDPTKPVNPFQPKPTGPVLPDKRQMAAFGGIMGMDGRRQYGIGSFFQKYIKDPIEMAITGKTYKQLEDESQARVDREPENYESVFDRLFKGEKGTDAQGKETRTGGLDKYIIPAIGGITAGLFTKKNQDGSSGGQPTADETALMLADLKKSANILDQKQGLAAGLNFLPDVAARKFTPDEMIEAYKTTAANGGRIGYQDAGPVLDEQTTQMILDMHGRGMDMDTIQTITQQDPKAINAIINSQNFSKQMPKEMAEGGRIGFSEGTNLRNKMSVLMNKMANGTITPEEMIELRNMESASMFSTAKGMAEGGLMDLGGMEKDYRAEGGFVPIGREEKADDVPARLSVNEFVFTADAVRNAGGGDIDEGARVMENMMKNLEAGGQVSEESQGMQGARDMFATSQRLGDVV